MYILYTFYTFTTYSTNIFIDKYTYKMTIPNKLIKKWDAELKEYGVLKSAEEMNLNYRTVRDAIKKGECSQKTFDTVNAYLLKKRSEIRSVTNKVLNEDQD